MLEESKIQGYLAFGGDVSIGWCNAADMDSYVSFVPEFARHIACGKTISIVCFEIAPEYRGMGLATDFIDRVNVDAKAEGYVAVEGYAKVTKEYNEFDYTLQCAHHHRKQEDFVMTKASGGERRKRDL